MKYILFRLQMPATDLLQEVWSWGFGNLTCILSMGLSNFIEIWGTQLWKLPFYMLIWHGMTLKASCILYDILRYKPAGRGFDSWWCHWNFSV